METDDGRDIGRVSPDKNQRLLYKTELIVQGQVDVKLPPLCR